MKRLETVAIVGVGLIYQKGYFRQYLNADGWQQERYEENDWYHMPVELVKDDHDQPMRVSVELDGTPVQMQIWKVQVGMVPLYLLDTNMRSEVRMLRDAGVLSEEQIDQAQRWAREATFVGGEG